MLDFFQRKEIKGWTFLLPALFINFLVILIPAFFTFLLAFTEWSGLGSITFVGLKNFRELFLDNVYLTSVLNNVKWTLIFLTVPIIMGVLAATMMQTVNKGKNIFQTIYFIPMIVSIVVSARVWQQMIFHPMSGLLGWLQRNGITLFAENPLTNPETSLYAVAFVDNWHWWGFLAVVFFAAMRQIDPSLYEVAEIEGASFWQKMRYISIPLIRPTLIFMILMTIIWSFLVFGYIFIMTEGGPGISSEVLATLTYRKAFYSYEIGKASAIALTMSFFAGIAITVYVWLQYKGVEL